MSNATLNVSLTYDEEFCELYNSIQNSPKGELILSMEGIGRDELDIRTMSKNYFTKDVASTSVDPNANANGFKTPTNYQGEVVKGFFKLNGYYLIWKELKLEYGLEQANSLMKNIIMGDLYFHDSTNCDVPYCFATSLLHLLATGRNWAPLKSTPPKRSDSFIAQVIETVMDMSQQFAGAIAMSDVLVCLSYFTRKENLPAYEIKNLLQRLVHSLNNTFRVSGQSPFTNLSIMDKYCYEHLYSGYVFPDGSQPDYAEFTRVQRIFGDWFSKGDPVSGLPYRFPVVTANLMVGPNREILDKEFGDWISEINLDKAFMNIYITTDAAKLASCCRLINDFSSLNIETGFGNGGLNIGSHRVVTINLARIGYIASKDPAKMVCFMLKLDEALNQCKCLLLAHRSLLKRRIEQGYLTFFNVGWCNLDRMFFSTIGLNGIYEAVQHLGYDPISQEGLDVAKTIMRYISDASKNFTKELGVPFNVEQIPAETVAVKFASKDRLLYDTKDEIYSNQYVPLTHSISLVDRMRIDGLLNKFLSGGGICHLNLGEGLNNKEQMKKIISLAIEYGLEHFAINYAFCICEKGHTVRGRPTTKICPICGSNIIDYVTRVIGYWVPVSAWNKTRAREFEKRNFGSYTPSDNATRVVDGVGSSEVPVSP